MQKFECRASPALDSLLFETHEIAQTRHGGESQLPRVQQAGRNHTHIMSRSSGIIGRQPQQGLLLERRCQRPPQTEATTHLKPQVSYDGTRYLILSVVH